MISIIEGVKKRGVFKSRVPEGKTGLGEARDIPGAVKEDGRPRYVNSYLIYDAIVYQVREREEPDPIFRLKNMDGGATPSQFRPLDMSWGNGNPAPGAGSRRAPHQKKSRLSS